MIEALPNPMPTTDGQRDTILADRIRKIGSRCAALGVMPTVLLSTSLPSDGKKRDRKILEALNADIVAIKKIDQTFNVALLDVEKVLKLRDPERDRAIIPSIEACITWANSYQPTPAPIPEPVPTPTPTPTPTPAPITVTLTTPASVVGGDGLTTKLVAMTTGDVVIVTFGIQSGPNVPSWVDMLPEQTTPTSPGRYEFSWSLNPIWTPPGDYVLFARALAADRQSHVIAHASVTVTETAPTPTPEPEPTPVPVPTPTPPPPTNARDIILSVIGPVKTIAETKALGGIFARYEEVFIEYLPASNLWGDNYYDRGVVYYAMYARTSDPVWLEKAHAITLEYRKWYLEPNGYGASPHWSMVRGLELHWRLTGDELSKKAVADMYSAALSVFSLPLWGDPKVPDLQNTQSPYMENRIQARVLQCALSCFRMGATAGAFSAATWPTELRKILNQILSVQNTNGSFSWAQICGGQLNYMVGMLNDVLIEYYRDFELDPRIPVAIEKANEYLWTTQWNATEQAFNYASVMCAPNPFGTNVGGTDPAGDLNGLLIASFGWLYSRTGDPKWKIRGDAIMAGLVSPQWVGHYAGWKQWNQAFAESYRYIAWR